MYTIVNEDVIKKAQAIGGNGEFEEGSPWASALTCLNSKGRDEIYPLLMANAASIIGVEWVAIIEKIEVREKRTFVQFSCLFEVSEPFPLNALTKASNGEPLAWNYIRPYVPCVIAGDLEEAVLNALREERDEVALPGLEIVETKSAEDYIAALLSVEESITENQRAMLIAHAEAPKHVLSMRALADVAGFPSHGMANIQYGKLGRKFAYFFDVFDLPNQTQALAWSDGTSDKDGHFTWILREPLVEALCALGWAKVPGTKGFAREVALREVDDDPKNQGLPATVREALVEARIGQGAYRKRMLGIWGGKCALTGCDLKEVLIASHAKPWADCNNKERLDAYNGLLLAAQVDKLFDCGLISFADDGELLLKPELTANLLATLGIELDMRLSRVSRQHLPYLKTHRARFGFDK